MKRKILSFLGLILLLTHVAAACQLLPSESVTTRTSATFATAPTATPSPTPEPAATPSPTPAPTATPSPTPAPTATPSPTPEPTATPSPTPAPTTTPAPTGWPHLNTLDNTKTGWYYVPASPLNADLPAVIPAAVQKLVQANHALWQEEDPSGMPLYLTMDMGYEYQNLTDGFLDIARDKGVPITFFITGNYLARNPERVQRMVQDGHLVVNHTQRHPNLPELLGNEGPEAILSELTQVEDDFRALTGQDMARFVRPPEGSYSERVLTLLDQAGYRTVFWSYAYRDWLTDDQPDPEAALDKALANLHPGSILLLHAVSETNQKILPSLIDAARERGYRFEPLTALALP
jgi:delta-lactam-biosynthetic de-N-acetylase